MSEREHDWFWRRLDLAQDEYDRLPEWMKARVQLATEGVEMMTPTRARMIFAAVKEWETAVRRVKDEANYGQGFPDDPLTDEKACEVAEDLGIAWVGLEVALRLEEASA